MLLMEIIRAQITVTKIRKMTAIHCEMGNKRDESNFFLVEITKSDGYH